MFRLPARQWYGLFLAFGILLVVRPELPAAERAGPNILWISCEDMSPTLGCYGDGYATTPNLDRLARQGVRYTRAFATAPVCSPARSCLITGVQATTLGTQRLRSRFPIPAEVQGFPRLLRQAGYFCSNNVKTDYNIGNEQAFIEKTWDVSSARAHWRMRRPGQPFFSVFNLMETHQSRASVWSFEEFEKNIGRTLPAELRHAPAKAPVPPYYPDTPLARRTLARHYDCVSAMDREVGRILARLEEDGLAGETIVVFFSDHGSGLPRHKRLLHDSGLHVPLLIRFPEKYRYLAPAGAGQSVDRLVSFVDFAPTMLALAGVPAPAHMQGKVFLGPRADGPRTHVYGARDRVDEAYDVARSIRDGRYLYIRNYMPHLAWAQPEGYSDAAPLRREVLRLARAGRLDAAQMTFAAPTRAPEELYDTEKDPHQIHNLAGAPGQRRKLEEMRRLLRRWILESRDLGFLPEEEAWRRAQGSTPYAIARREGKYPLKRILAAAEMVGSSEAAVQTRHLEDADPAVRYWAAVGLHAAGEAARPHRQALKKALLDPSPPVRIEAATALAALGEPGQSIEVLVRELREGSPEASLRAARALQLLGERAGPARAAMREVLKEAEARKDRDDFALYLTFSLGAALDAPGR